MYIRVFYVHHSLLDESISSCLASDEICPLTDDDRHEVGGVDRVLKTFALSESLDSKKPHAPITNRLKFRQIGDHNEHREVNSEINQFQIT